MSSLLHVACRVQAAVKAYNSVKDYADREKWKAQFVKEKVRPVVIHFSPSDFILVFEKYKSALAFRQERAEHPRQEAPNLHPLVAALMIVLENDEDFSLITENYPRLKKDKYYNPKAVFPDLSPFLPRREDRWWEDLGVLLFHSFISLFSHEATAAEARPRQMLLRFDLQEMLQGPVDPEKQNIHEEPAAPKELAAAVPTRSRKSKILTPQTPSKRQDKPAESNDTAMAVDEPIKVSISHISLSLSLRLTVSGTISASS